MGEEIKQLILRVMAMDRRETSRALLVSSKKSSKLGSGGKARITSGQAKSGSELMRR